MLSHFFLDIQKSGYNLYEFLVCLCVCRAGSVDRGWFIGKENEEGGKEEKRRVLCIWIIITLDAHFPSLGSFDLRCRHGSVCLHRCFVLLQIRGMEFSMSQNHVYNKWLCFPWSYWKIMRTFRVFRVFFLERKKQ